MRHLSPHVAPPVPARLSLTSTLLCHNTRQDLLLKIIPLLDEYIQISERAGSAAGRRVEIWRQAVGLGDQKTVVCALHILCKRELALADAPKDVGFRRRNNCGKAESCKTDIEVSQLAAIRHVGCRTASCSVERGGLTKVTWLPCGRRI